MKRPSIFFAALLVVPFLAPMTASAAPWIATIGDVSPDFDGPGPWAPPGPLSIGDSSAGHVLIMGGASLTTGAVVLGDEAFGQLTLIDGTWTANSNVIIGGVGLDGVGMVNLYGGTWTATDGVWLGNGPNLSTINLDGGTMSIAGSDLHLGSNALFSIGGGTLNLSGNFSVPGTDRLQLVAGELQIDGLLTGLEGATGGRVVLQGGSARWETADAAINGLTLDGGTFEVTGGGSAAFSSDIQFTANGGTILLDDALLVQGTQTIFLDGNLISGTGEIVVGSAGLDLGTVASPGSLLGTDAGDPIVLYGNVSGSGSLVNTTIFGDLDIGSSPGEISLENVALYGSGLIEMEIGGLPAEEYDRLLIGPGVDLGAAEFNITFTGAFSPPPNETFNLFTPFGGGDLSSALGGATLTAPEGWFIDLSSGTLAAVPEPGTFLLLATGLLAAAALRRRRRRSWGA